MTPPLLLSILLGLSAAAMAQTFPAREFTAKQLVGATLSHTAAPAHRASAYLAEAEQLLRTSAGDTAQLNAASQALNRALNLAPPSPLWFALMYTYHRQLNHQTAAQDVLNSGIAVYPYSTQLHYLRGLTQLKAGTLPNRAAILAASLPRSVKYLLASELAKQHNDPIYAALDAERAYYLQQADFTQAIAATRMAELYVQQHKLIEQDSAAHLAAAYPAGSFEAAYAASVRAAVAQHEPLEFLLEHIPQLRVQTLRHFARAGKLGRFPDPLLVDLWVLDQAGYLAWATRDLLLPQDRAGSTSPPQQAQRARDYMTQRWAQDVDHWLDRVGQ